MASRISSLDKGYLPGDLSVYPNALDSSSNLYIVANNAETTLSQALTYNGQTIVVDSTTGFPSQGLIRVGTELVYYGSLSVGVFQNLVRGFAGSRQSQWPQGTAVTNSVEAEPHNSIKDAIINIESYVGLKSNPSSTSLNGILTAQENRFLSPRPIFKAMPISGPPPLKVRFQNFSNTSAVKFLWDFGDGGVSTDVSPTHTYLNEGIFTVQLRTVTSLKGQGVTTKSGYITVSNAQKPPLMYTTPSMGTTATTFTFIDQTDGQIVSRHWIFGDGAVLDVNDPDIHTATYQYSTPGTYTPTLLVVFSDGTQVAVNSSQSIIVTP